MLISDRVDGENNIPFSISKLESLDDWEHGANVTRDRMEKSGHHGDMHHA